MQYWHPSVTQIGQVVWWCVPLRYCSSSSWHRTSHAYLSASVNIDFLSISGLQPRYAPHQFSMGSTHVLVRNSSCRIVGSRSMAALIWFAAFKICLDVASDCGSRQISLMACCNALCISVMLSMVPPFLPIARIQIKSKWFFRSGLLWQFWSVCRRLLEGCL